LDLLASDPMLDPALLQRVELGRAGSCDSRTNLRRYRPPCLTFAVECA
jgi:hypothetical protein